MAKKEKKLYTSEMLDDAIRKKYEGDAWIVLSEVRNGTGWSQRERTADAMAFGMWPSRGLDIIGFEIKVDRQDWKRELINPAKAHEMSRRCDQWWVVSPEEVVELEEIPRTWGWYIPHGKGLKAMRQPEQKPAPDIQRTFMMSVIRNFSKSYIPRWQVQKEVEAGVKASERRKGYQLERLEKLADRVQAFEQASGLQLDNEYSWPAGEVGEIVRAVLDKSLGYKLEQVKKTLEELERVGKEIHQLPFMRKPKEDGKKCAIS